MDANARDGESGDGTVAHRGEIIDEPFGDWPAASTIGAAAPIQAISVLGRRLPRRFGPARILGSMGLVLIVAAMLRVYTGLL